MNKEIESERNTIMEVFNKWYKIPNYQRPYVWEEEQIVELIDSIVNAMNSDKDSEYFIGTMVLRKKMQKEEDSEIEYIEYELLDGQQRLTTLLLIFAVLRDIEKENNKIEKACNAMICQDEDVIRNIPERSRITFEIREEANKFFTEYIKEKGGTDKKEELELISNNEEKDVTIRNMAKAILVINNYFKEKAVKIFDLCSYITNKVLMVYIATNDLNDAFQLFTVMNNTGIKLRNSDILKANNLAAIETEKTRNEKAKEWEDIESYFGDDFDNFLSLIRTILVKKKANYNLLKEFNDNIYEPKEFDRETQQYKKIEPLLKKGTETFALIKKYYDKYIEIFDNINEKNKDRQELNNYLILMENGFEADFWKAPILEFYSKFGMGNLLDFVKLLDKKFSTDWIISLTPTERIESINKIIQLIDDATCFDDISNSDKLSINYNDLKRVIKGNIYGRKYAKYLLLKLNLICSASETQMLNIPNIISIEHILPQTPAEDSQWKKDFTDEEREQYTDKLGNLMLISRRKNSSLGNLDYDKKKEKYFLKSIEVLPHTAKIYNEYDEWNTKNYKANQKLMEKMLLLKYNAEDSEYKD